MRIKLLSLLMQKIRGKSKRNGQNKLEWTARTV
jgi:hypothetical protein